jgi:hypothetical protein
MRAESLAPPFAAQPCWAWPLPHERGHRPRRLASLLEGAGQAALQTPQAADARGRRFHLEQMWTWEGELPRQRCPAVYRLATLVAVTVAARLPQALIVSPESHA